MLTQLVRMVVLFIFFSTSIPCCLLWSPPIACAFSFRFHSPLACRDFSSSFVRCYFDAINRILFTMCSNRKMFSNKFMGIFVRFHGRFTLYVYFFLFAPLQDMVASPSCFHVPTCDNKNLKRFYKRAWLCALSFLSLHTHTLILIAASNDLLLLCFVVVVSGVVVWPLTRIIATYVCANAIKTNFMTNKWH